MNVSCPSCNTVFRVDPAKVPEGGVRARCNICRAVFRVAGEIMPDARPEAAVPAYRVPGPPATAPESTPAPAEQRPAPAPHEQPAAAVPPRPPVAPAEPVAPPSAAPAIPATRSVPREPGVAPRTAAPPVAAPVSGRPFMPPATPTAPMAPPTPARHAAPAPRPATGAPVNPFLSQDPNQKARRLARALVSDLVVYHPDKRQEGIRDGTLKELFNDEIQKSWEEFTEQVGPDVAEAASYFNDALNEILSDGRKIF